MTIDGASLVVSVGLVGIDVTVRGLTDLSAAFASAGEAAVGLYAQSEGLAISLTQIAKTQLNNFRLMRAAETDLRGQFRESMEYSKQIIEYAKQRALLSSYASSDIAQMLQTSMGFGFDAVMVQNIQEAQKREIITAQRLVDAFVNFGAAQAVAVHDLRQMVLTVGKTFGDKYQAIDIDILTERGLPVEAILMQSLNKTKQEIRDMRMARQLTDDMVTPSLVEWMEKTYPGAAEQMANTTAGLLAQFADIRAVLTQNLFGDAIEAMKAPFAQLIASMQSDEAAAGVKSWALWIRDMAKSAAESADVVIGHVQNIYEHGEKIENAFRFSIYFSGLTNIVPILALIGKGLASLTFSPAFASLTRGFAMVAPSAMLFANLIRDDVIPAISDLNTYINTLSVAAAGMFLAMKGRALGDMAFWAKTAYDVYKTAYGPPVALEYTQQTMWKSPGTPGLIPPGALFAGEDEKWEQGQRTTRFEGAFVSKATKAAQIVDLLIERSTA